MSMIVIVYFIISFNFFLKVLEYNLGR